MNAHKFLKQSISVDYKNYHFNLDHVFLSHWFHQKTLPKQSRVEFTMGYHRPDIGEQLTPQTRAFHRHKPAMEFHRS